MTQAGTAPTPTIQTTAPSEPAPAASLVERLSAVDPGERATILLAAIAAGEPLDLAGADLRGIDLRPGRPARSQIGSGPALVPNTVVLDGADLSQAILSRAHLSRVSLRGACLDGALLVGAVLSGADLSGASLRGANLTDANLSRAELSFANLHSATFLTANLTEVIATGADLRETILHAAALPRAVLRAADLRWAALDGANLGGALLSGARFEGASLNLTNLSGARLSPNTDFSYAFLRYARLERTALGRVHLQGGIGEAATEDLELRWGTYRALQRLFETEGNLDDARWAHRQAMRARTTSYRPDLAPRYHGAGERPSSADLRPRPQPGVGQPGPFFAARNALRWCLGLLADLSTGYGTSLRRVLASLALTWLAFAALFFLVGGIVDLSGRLTQVQGALIFSAAALTPVDPYPLAAISGGARGLAIVEGLLGMLLVAAMGYVGLGRLRG